MKTLLKILLLQIAAIAIIHAQAASTPLKLEAEQKQFVDLSEGYTSFEKLASKDQLVKKANKHYINLEYVKAAQIYDYVIDKNNIRNINPRVIEAAANSNFLYNNIERANELYAQVYGNKKYTMATTSLFRYLHTLKGIGDKVKVAEIQKEYISRLKTEKSARVQGVKMRYNEEFDIKVSNLNFNSGLSEFAPMFAGKNKIVFASTKNRGLLKKNYKWNKQPFLDLYTAKLNANKELVKLEKLPKEINSKLHEASVTFSPDGRTMYFTRNQAKRNGKREKNLKIYKTVINAKGKWSKAKALPFNNPNYSYGHPAVSNDGRFLYFTSNMPGGFGQTDIYKVRIFANGKYSKPENLGETVNSRFSEAFPFVSHKKLYFSSNRTNGYGGMDIYETDIIKNGFTPSKNIGTPFNSNRDDISFIINEASKEGYFASNRKGGKGDDDIYYFTLKEKDLTGAIVGIASDQQNEFINNVKVQLLNENNQLIKEVSTNSNGNFVFQGVLKGNKYTLKVTHPEYEEKVLPLKGGWDEAEKQVNVELTKVESKLPPVVTKNNVKKIDLAPVHFDFDKYFVRKDAAQQLQSLVKLLQENPNMVIKIEAHTDARGSKTYNQLLSEKRAKSIKQFILKNGIHEKQIQSAIGYGEDKLLNDCSSKVPCTKKMHELNRRTEFIIVE